MSILHWIWKLYHAYVVAAAAVALLAFLLWLWALFGCDNDSR